MPTLPYTCRTGRAAQVQEQEGARLHVARCPHLRPTLCPRSPTPAVQGALRKYKSKKAHGFTRNYTALWEEMVAARPAPGQRRAEVCVLGKGGFRWQLEIPAEIDGDVEFLTQLPYPVRACAWVDGRMDGWLPLASAQGTWVGGWM
eukprot:163101-Chlamydomonas_euryale.AAC.1